MRDFLIITIFLSVFSFLLGQTDNSHPRINRKFIPAGSIEALVDGSNNMDLLLVQLDLKNDSLFTLVNDVLPDMELFSGPASYHRIMNKFHLDQIRYVLTEEYFSVLDDNYNLSNTSRDFWEEQKNGNDVLGTQEEVNNNDCMCLEDASDCIVVGYNDDWWDPLDYWGEAWYGFQPPYHQSVDEIRVTVRGGQCDDLPVWSETYMGMMDDDGNWSSDYELSIDYTDNIFIVGNTWSNSMLVPRIGSEDNYCIDHVKLEFYYTCLPPSSPADFSASDGEYENQIRLSWSGVEGAEFYNIYRDNEFLTMLLNDQLEIFIDSDEPNVVIEFCISSVNTCGESNLECDTGYAAEPLSSINVDYHFNWNLVSLPLVVEDALYSNLFPEAIDETLYSFDLMGYVHVGDGYNPETFLLPGIGYWLRFTSDGSTNISGTLIHEQTYSLYEGWNLISGISEDISIYSASDPENIIIHGSVYGFHGGNTGYISADILSPGKGYWIRANADGEIILVGQ